MTLEKKILEFDQHLETPGKKPNKLAKLIYIRMLCKWHADGCQEWTTIGRSHFSSVGIADPSYYAAIRQLDLYGWIQKDSGDLTNRYKFPSLKTAKDAV